MITFLKTKFERSRRTLSVVISTDLSVNWPENVCSLLFDPSPRIGYTNRGVELKKHKNKIKDHENCIALPRNLELAF